MRERKIVSKIHYPLKNHEIIITRQIRSLYFKY
jgi:hypothetical protein